MCTWSIGQQSEQILALRIDKSEGRPIMLRREFLQIAGMGGDFCLLHVMALPSFHQF
jgi:hypothetical protein